MEDAEEKCGDPTRRPEGDFKAVPCADRTDETSSIGDHLGSCVITCGELERVWQVYSGTIEDIAPFCPEGFFTPDGEKVE